MADKSDQGGGAQIGAPLARDRTGAAAALVDGRAINARIEQLLDGRPMSWLSDSASVASSTLSDMKKGKVPHARTLVAVAQTLRVDLLWLLTGSRDQLDAPGSVPTSVTTAGSQVDELATLFAQLGNRERQAILSMVRIMAAGGGEVEVRHTVHSGRLGYKDRDDG